MSDSTTDARVRIMTMDLEDAPDADHSAVVALNVLEHIDDDSAEAEIDLESVRYVNAPGLAAWFLGVGVSGSFPATASSCGRGIDL